MRHISTTEAARRLGKNRLTIRRWAERGVFPGAKRMGKPWMIPEVEVERIERDGYDPRGAEAERGVSE